MPLTQVRPVSVTNWLQSPLFTEQQVNEFSDVIALYLFEFLAEVTPFDLTSSILHQDALADYIKRHVDYLGMNEIDLIVMYILIDRYLKKTNNSLRHSNIQKLITIGALLAYKLGEEEGASLKLREYPDMLGFFQEEINSLELQFLSDIQHELWVSELPYLMTKKKLIDFAQQRLISSCLSLNQLELDRLNELQYPKPLSADQLMSREAAYSPRLFTTSVVTAYKDTDTQHKEEKSSCCCW